MPMVAVDPAAPQTHRLNRLHPALKRLRRCHPPGDVPQTGLIRLGDLQTVVVIILIRAQIDRLPGTLRLFETQQIFEEPEGVVQFWREDFDVRQLRDVKDRFFVVSHGLSSFFAGTPTVWRRTVASRCSHRRG
jgi:hypothetical protein